LCRIENPRAAFSRQCEGFSNDQNLSLFHLGKTGYNNRGIIPVLPRRGILVDPAADRQFVPRGIWSITMGWEYSEKTKQLFMDAVQGKPGTHLGEIENPDGIGEHGSIACGDAMRFMFRVRRHPGDPTQDVITEAKYLTFGCTSAIASSEALCEIIERGGYTPIEALKIRNSDIVEYLQGLPEQKIHCSVMGAEALEAAVFNWAQRRGVDLKSLGVDIHDQETEEGRIVCKCFSLTEPYLKRKIRELKLRTIPEITNAVKAGGGCTSCHHVPGGLQDLLDEVWLGKPHAVPPESPRFEILPTETRQIPELSPYQFSKKVEKAIDEYVRPALRADGGNVEILDIKGMLVYCRLDGACSGCIGAGHTLKMMIERHLKDQVDERIRVIQV
jgi:NifU-like protein